MEKQIFLNTFASSSVPAGGARYGQAFWERLWRTAGVQSSGLFVFAWLLYPTWPSVAAALAGLAVLNLMWFAAALRAALADAGQDGWGGAATAASAALGGLLILIIALAQTAPETVPGLTRFAWAGWVMTSFPRAMLIMAGTFGFWRAKAISNKGFAVGILAVLLVLAGGFTWADNGIWALDGLYSRLILPAICLAWVLAASWVLLARIPSAHRNW